MVKVISIPILFIFIVNIILPNPNIYLQVSPHEDPNMASSELDPASLLTYYILIFRSLLGLKNLNLTELLSAFKYMDLPNDIIYIINRLNELSASLYNDINQTSILLDRAKLLIEYRAYEEAYNLLEQAKIHIYNANRTLNQIELVINELRSRLSKYIIDPNDPRFTMATQEFKFLINRLNELLQELFNLLNKLFYEAESGLTQIPGLLTTFITIYTNASVVRIGDELLIYGVLNSSKGPLINRKVNIISPFANVSVLTDEEGRYEAILFVSGYYKNSAIIDVFYIPTGDDKNLYKPAHNKTIIKVIYIKTKLIVDAPKFAYPGLSVEFIISIFPWSENVSRKLLVKFDNEVLYSGYVYNSTIKITKEINDKISLGPHMLHVYVFPFIEYSDATYDWILIVTYKRIYFSVESAGSYAIFPLGKIRIFGEAKDLKGNPLINETIEIKAGNRLYTLYTNDSGKFAFSLDAPFLFGDYYITVTFKPREKWYPIVTRQLKIYVINAVVLLLFVSSITIISIYLDLNPKKLLRYIPRPRPAPSPTTLKSREVAFRESKRQVAKKAIGEWVILKGIGKIIPIYKAVISYLSKIIGLPKPTETVREYYRKAEPHITPVKSEFWKLTLYTEYELYSGKSIKESMVREAKRLKEVILRVLKR